MAAAGQPQFMADQSPRFDNQPGRRKRMAKKKKKKRMYFH